MQVTAVGAVVEGMQVRVYAGVPFEIRARVGDSRYGNRFSAALLWVEGGAGLPEESFTDRPAGSLLRCVGVRGTSGRAVGMLQVKDDRGGELVIALELLVMDARAWGGVRVAGFSFRSLGLEKRAVFGQGAPQASFRWRTT